MDSKQNTQRSDRRCLDCGRAIGPRDGNACDECFEKFYHRMSPMERRQHRQRRDDEALRQSELSNPVGRTAVRESWRYRGYDK